MLLVGTRHIERPSKAAEAGSQMRMMVHAAIAFPSAVHSRQCHPCPALRMAAKEFCF